MSSKYFIGCLLLLASCSPKSLDDLRVESDAEVKKIVAEMRRVDTKEELLKKAPLLKKRFTKLGMLLESARKLGHHPVPPTEASEALFIEMARLYEIPGAREIIEEAESDAIRRL